MLVALRALVLRRELVPPLPVIQRPLLLVQPPVVVDVAGVEEDAVELVAVQAVRLASPHCLKGFPRHPRSIPRWTRHRRHSPLALACIRFIAPPGLGMATVSPVTHIATHPMVGCPQ